MKRKSVYCGQEEIKFTRTDEEVVIRQLCFEQLKPAMEQLTADERNLLYDIYYEGVSERFLAENGWG